MAVNDAVTVGARKRDKREATLPYKSMPLDEITVGVQRLAVICPIEEQRGVDEMGSCGEKI